MSSLRRYLASHRFHPGTAFFVIGHGVLEAYLTASRGNRPTDTPAKGKSSAKPDEPGNFQLFWLGEARLRFAGALVYSKAVLNNRLRSRGLLGKQTVLPIPPDDLEQIKQWHFAVGGLDTQQETLEIGGPIRLRRLKLFPTHEQLALSLSSLPVAGAMALYGEKIVRHELVIDASRFEENTERIFPTAEAILAGLRIRTGAEIVCPAVCEHSWAALRTSPPNKCRAFHFERGLSHQAAMEPKLLLTEDVGWVRDNLATVIRLTDDESFQTAVEALCTYMLASNDRMKVAQLWAGVEALFDIEYELRYRLATLSAKLLGSTPFESKQVYADMKALYGERSKIIHGKQIGKKKDAHDGKVREHIIRIRTRLAQLLTKLIAIGRVPTEEEFEEMLFQK